MLGGALRKARRERLFRFFRTALAGDRREIARDARLRVQTLVDGLRVRFGSQRYEKAPDDDDIIARDQALAQVYVEAQARYAQTFAEDAIVLLSRTYKAALPPANLDLRPVPVDHTTLFLEPQVRELADAFRRAAAERFARTPA